MATDGGVRRMEDWPRAHYRFRAQEQIFDLEQIAIAEHGLQRRHFRVRPEHEDSIETVDDGQQRGDVGRIARPHLRADRPPGAIDDQRQDHLLQIGSVILGPT